MKSNLGRSAGIVRAFAGRDLSIALSYRAGFLVSKTAPAYAVVLFYFISRVVGESPTVGDADGYFRFVVIGIALGEIMRVAASAAAHGARRDQIEGTLENLMASPVAPGTLAVGWSSYPVMDSMITAAITVAVAVPLGLSIPAISVAPLVCVLVLTAFAFVAIGMLGAALVIAFQQGAAFVSLVMGLLAILSGAVFPVEVLPSPLEELSKLSPLTHAYDAARAATLHGASLSDIGGDLLVLFATGAVTIPIGIWALDRATATARSRGKLSSF